MRAVIAAVAVLGYSALAAALSVSVAAGDGGETRWLLYGPVPFCVIGAVGFLRRPQNRVVWWLVGFGAAFGAQLALGDVLVPAAEQHWALAAPGTVLAALVGQWSGAAISVAIIGLFGLFPSGRPVSRPDRLVIWAAAAMAAAVPVLSALSGANLALTGWPPGQDLAPLVSFGAPVAALAPLSGLSAAAWACWRCATGTARLRSGARSADCCSA